MDFTVYATHLNKCPTSELMRLKDLIYLQGRLGISEVILSKFQCLEFKNYCLLTQYTMLIDKLCLIA